MLDLEQRRERDRSLRTSDVAVPTPGKSTRVQERTEGESSRTGSYVPTFDRHHVKTPWSTRAETPPPAALDLGEAKVGVVNLGTGTPRDQIQEHVNHMAFAWNAMIDNLTEAMLLTIQTVEHAAFKKAPDGLIMKLWARAECLLARAATFVTGGTSLAATIGVTAIKRIVALGERLEASRVQETKDAFVRELRQHTKAVKLAGLAEGANLDVHKIVSELDAQFAASGRDCPEDAWKRGDQGVVGAQAVFLKQLEQRSREYAASVPAADDFEREFLAAWITANHGERNRSALRSPLAPASYADGFVSIDVMLDYDVFRSRFAIGYQDSATLHCPQSREVAKQLTRSNGARGLDELGIPIHLRVRTSDEAWDKVPAHWKRDRQREIRFDSGRQIENTAVVPYWRWLMQSARTSLTEIFEPVRTLRG